MRTKTVKFGDFDVVFIQMPSKIWITPTRTIGVVLGYTANGQKLSDHISGKWSDEFEKDDKVILDALHLSEIRKYVPDFETSSANSMSFLTLKGVMKVILKSRSEVAEKFREELIAQIPDAVQQHREEENMKELPEVPKTETKKNPDAVLNALKSLPKKPNAKLGGAFERFSSNKAKSPNTSKAKTPKAKQLTLDISSKGDSALDALMKTLEFGQKWNVFSKADVKATLQSIRDTQLGRYVAEVERLVAIDKSSISVTTGRISHKDATQMVPVSNVQASSLTPNFDQIRGFFLTGHQKHPRFTDYLSAEEIGNLVNKTADQVRDPIKKYVNGLGHELPNVQIQKLIKDRGGYFRGIATFLDKENLPVFNIEGVGMTTWFVMEDGKFVWRNYWHPDVVKGVLTSLGFPTVSELPDPEKFREHNPSTK